MDRKTALEKRYPDMCGDIKEVMEKDACVEIWGRAAFDGNEEKITQFEDAIFKYMQSNVALVSIYMKEPYCTKILQDVNITW